jgi:hypothetical protein
MMPSYSQNSLLRMVINALLGGYGLTLLTIAGLILLLYVLYQLGLI